MHLALKFKLGEGRLVRFSHFLGFWILRAPSIVLDPLHVGLERLLTLLA
jgi:hypothetical protein